MISYRSNSNTEINAWKERREKELKKREIAEKTKVSYFGNDVYHLNRSVGGSVKL